MISPRISQEKFEKNLEIQKKIGQLYGYHLKNQEFQIAKPRQKEKKEKVVINESINPLQVKQKQIEPSFRLKELNKQMEQLEIQKKISKMTDQQGSSNLDVPHLINTKIKEYNYLIDHKHLIRHKPAKSFFQSTKQPELTPESTSLLQKIMVKQKDLNKTSSFLNRFRNNRQIIGLFREYSQSMRLGQRLKASSTNIAKAPKMKGNFLQDIKSQVKIKTKQSMDLRGKKRYEDQINISSPFIEDKFIQSSQELNESIRRSRKQSHFIKQKLMNLKIKNEGEITQLLDEESPKKEEHHQDIKTNMSEFSVAYNSWNPKVKQTNADQKQCQKSYVSQALQKISPKYVKCEGSKFLMKFDTKQAANSMIEGPKYKKKKQEPALISNIKKAKIPAHLNEEDKMVMGFMIEEQSDSYYWTTCKNQKINLMLKRHGPH